MSCTCCIKTNIKAKFVLFIFPFIFLVASLFCLIFCLTNGSFYDTCYAWFSTTFHLHGVCMGFYTAIFNPICFVGYNHGFVKLEQRCNPVGRIARTIRRLNNWFENPNVSSYTHHDALVNMV